MQRHQALAGSGLGLDCWKPEASPQPGTNHRGRRSNGLPQAHPLGVNEEQDLHREAGRGSVWESERGGATERWTRR